jgi:hypothetical protein
LALTDPFDLHGHGFTIRFLFLNILENIVIVFDFPIELPHLIMLHSLQALYLVDLGGMVFDEFAHLLLVTFFFGIDPVVVGLLLLLRQVVPCISDELGNSSSGHFSVLAAQLLTFLLIVQEEARDWLFGLVLQLVLLCFVEKLNFTHLDLIVAYLRFPLDFIGLLVEIRSPCLMVFQFQ